MDDLASMINQVMQNPDAMRQLNDVAASLGLSSGAPAQQQTQAPPTSSGGMPDLSALLGGQGQAQSSGQSAPSLDMGTLMLLQNAMRTFSNDDQNTQFLRAMKPLLSAERAKKIDDAIKVLGLMKLLPLLRDSGFLFK